MTVGIPLFAVERVLKVRMEDMVTVANRACLVVDGRTLPVCRLQQLLNPQDAPEAMERNSLFVVVLKAGVARSAVVVDQLVGERNSVIRDIRGPAGSDARFSGSILLDDGRLALVVHPPALLDSAPGAAPLPAAKESESLSVSRDPLILIVDDSFTTRTLEKNILETRGYAVRVAVDGADALKQLRSESIDLVVSDIQMPHVDGFQMLEAMRADVRLAEIPVILVTSMDRCEYRERGLALGAHAYIVKQRFDHEELLATIGRFVEPNHGPIAARVGASIT